MNKRTTKKSRHEAFWRTIEAMNLFFAMNEEELDKNIKQRFPGLQVSGTEKEKLLMLVKDEISRRLDEENVSITPKL